MTQPYERLRMAALFMPVEKSRGKFAAVLPNIKV